MRRSRLLALAALTISLLAVGFEAHAAKSPFGIATPDSTGNSFGGPFGPIFAWIAFHQAQFYRSMTATLDRLKTDGSGLWLLLGVSFAYGVFHAVGPGHGKAVITSYLLASGDTARRGIVLSFLAALVQALSAIIIVAVLAVVFRVTAMVMTDVTDWIEVVSYAAIVLFGAWLLWSKIRGHDHHHHHYHHGAPLAEAKASDSIDKGVQGHEHVHHHDDQHGHEHAHQRESGGILMRVQPGNGKPILARAWAAILAVGIRPCSGALIVLVFALSQGIFAAGIAATFVMALGTGLTVATLATVAVAAKDIVLRFAGGGSLAMGRLARFVEIGGAAAVLLLGLLLLGGSLYGGLPRPG